MGDTLGAVACAPLLLAAIGRRRSGFAIAAPTENERMRPVLWRFWRRLPAAGRLAIFDRSWYRAVLDGLANDEMDDGLWEILSELEANEEVRAVIWRANGKSPYCLWIVNTVLFINACKARLMQISSA